MPELPRAPSTAARAIVLGRVRKRRVAERPEGVGDGAERQAEVGAGVAVGHREDVDAVDLVAAGGHPVGGREERAGQPGPVDVGDAGGHRRYSGTMLTFTSA